MSTKPLKLLFMADIYNILLKHFLNETSENEENEIAKFKKSNSEEYAILSHLWKRNDIEVIDFDSKKAWEQVQLKVDTNKPKIRPFYTKLMRIVAVAAILIIGIFSIYYLLGTGINQNRIEITSIERGKEIVLADGSKVWLNKNAVLTYPDKFDKNTRNVELSGEAFFEIAKNPSKPFIVNMSNATVTVVGTSFNINSKENETEIVVATGTVKVTDTDNSKSELITVGYSAKVKDNNIEKYKTSSPNYLAWRTGEFVFKDTPINQVVKDLNSYYESQIILNNDEIECLFTATFIKANLGDIVDVLKLTCDIEIIKEDNNYKIIK
jgi:ferric-dicitrate binding protein FerR (iron transport regulator)